MSQPSNKFKVILTEFFHHLPFSVFGVMSALLVMGILNFIVHIAHAEHQAAHASEELFHVFHAMHVLISAVATTAMFWRHDDRNVFKAMAIGFFGSIILCALSDILIPYWGGQLLGWPVHMHICSIEEPLLVLPFAVAGTLAGLGVTQAFEKSTEYSHGMHVFISSAASLLYLISFGLDHWVHAIGGVFVLTVFAVMLPCCLSDIVFPMLCTHRHCKTEDDDECPINHHH